MRGIQDEVGLLRYDGARHGKNGGLHFLKPMVPELLNRWRHWLASPSRGQVPGIKLVHKLRVKLDRVDQIGEDDRRVQMDECFQSRE